MSLIKGMHHISIKCCSSEEFDRVIAFYNGILGLPIERTWDTGVMLDTGSGLIEVFNNGDVQLPQGAIRHVALMTDSVDECVAAVTEAGYEVFVGPKDIEVPAHARIAFCRGPVGEDVEFFQER